MPFIAGQAGRQSDKMPQCRQLTMSRTTCRMPYTTSQPMTPGRRRGGTPVGLWVGSSPRSPPPSPVESLAPQASRECGGKRNTTHDSCTLPADAPHPVTFHSLCRAAGRVAREAPPTPTPTPATHTISLLSLESRSCPRSFLASLQTRALPSVPSKHALVVASAHSHSLTLPAMPPSRPSRNGTHQHPQRRTTPASRHAKQQRNTYCPHTQHGSVQRTMHTKTQHTVTRRTVRVSMCACVSNGNETRNAVPKPSRNKRRCNTSPPGWGRRVRQLTTKHLSMRNGAPKRTPLMRFKCLQQPSPSNRHHIPNVLARPARFWPNQRPANEPRAAPPPPARPCTHSLRRCATS
ncbi:hypothetical protein PLESTB_001469600 [Pleodorina starrii]|uniref:Uncharacterized protein n=1 Tax=Pleodorina starrii TaxID=330485 RepID=A0A9W6F7L2_9CHLO|nr:hypothetical protein PLESTB_001469600 [Pleodorina starrii]